MVDHRCVQGRGILRQPLRDYKSAGKGRVDSDRVGTEPLLATQIVDVPTNEHFAGRSLRVARRHDSGSPKVPRELIQGGAVLVPTTRRTRQERLHTVLVDICDRDACLTLPPNKVLDQSLLVVPRLLCVAAPREGRDERGQVNGEIIHGCRP
jgi:hypothetical protein